jgi:hypothetical protein
MRLVRAEISNFRSIASQTISFDPRCRVLVGINESGKTNILKALSMLDPESKPAADDLRDIGPDEDPNIESKVLFVFATTAGERSQVLAGIKKKVLGSIDDPIIVRGGRELSLAQFVMEWADVVYRVKIENGEKRFVRWSESDVEIVGPWYRPKQGTNIAIVVSEGTRNSNEFEVIGSPFGTELADAYREPLTSEKLLALLVSEFAEVVELPDVVMWKYEEANLLPGSIQLQAFAAAPNTCLPLKHMFTLAGYNDISGAIQLAQRKKNGLTNLLSGVARATTSHIVKVWKEFKGLTLELVPNGANIDATIQDTYNRYDLARRSDGFKRFVSFVLSISVKAKTKELTNSLYLHDEPDTSLHPSGARYLREELIRLSDANYVVYSTHSIFMIDRENLGRHLIVRKQKERTTLEEVTASNIVDEEVIYNALGYSIFEQLKAKNILFEGWRDKRLFQVRLGRLAASHSDKRALSELGVCHVKGVRDIGRVTPMLELAQRQWIVVSDCDQIAREHQRKYDGHGPWFRYDELGVGSEFITSEDFIEWSAFNSALERLISENPNLQRQADWESLPGSGKIEKLKRWMENGGLTPEQIKGCMEQIKEEVFQSLKSNQIRTEYVSVMQEIAAKMRELEETSVPL